MEEKLDALEKKYFDLVWLARNGLEDEARPDASTHSYENPSQPPKRSAGPGRWRRQLASRVQ